jgi:hypothetical protein
MPIHDWTRVKSGIFHHFHLEWIGAIARKLNQGLLPKGFYALAEQIAGGVEPDVLTLQLADLGNPDIFQGSGRFALATSPPKVRYRAKADIDKYAAKAKAVTIRHVSNHKVIAVVEIVSPGNKSDRAALREFVEKAAALLRAGIHLLIVDLFPPSVRDPQGIHKAIWDQIEEVDFSLPPDQPLTLAAYTGGPTKEAFVEPTAVGMKLVGMPLFLDNESYVMTPLEATYQSAWEAVPEFWREVLEKSA